MPFNIVNVKGGRKVFNMLTVLYNNISMIHTIWKLDSLIYSVNTLAQFHSGFSSIHE